MAVLRFREAAEEAETGEPTMGRAINSARMSVKLTEDGTPNFSSPKLLTPTEDLAAELAAADAAISGIEKLLGKVKTSQKRASSEPGRPQAGARRVARPRRAAY
jgi:hypothetical protein